MEAGRSVLSKVLISGGGRCNVMHNPMKGSAEIAKVMCYVRKIKCTFVAAPFDSQSIVFTYQAGISTRWQGTTGPAER